MTFLVVPSLFVAFLAVGLLGSSPQELVGKSAPEFELPVLGSKEKLTSAELKGSPVVVNFWASWCIPCKEEAPTLEEKWRKYRAEGIRFVGVNVQDLEQDATAFVEEFGITFPSVRDTELELWNQFGVRGLPETFFIDHQWKFVSVGAGKEIGNRGATKILGAISPAVLESQIRALLERSKKGG
ncbi:MAG: TlpA family protein disulfide reductase [Actinobacteria bacterium]|nr:TlpA family protein disulfide reductase [Actinomycetota bacterium]